MCVRIENFREDLLSLTVKYCVVVFVLIYVTFRVHFLYRGVLITARMVDVDSKTEDSILKTIINLTQVSRQEKRITKKMIKLGLLLVAVLAKASTNTSQRKLLKTNSCF